MNSIRWTPCSLSREKHWRKVKRRKKWTQNFWMSDWRWPRYKTSGVWKRWVRAKAGYHFRTYTHISYHVWEIYYEITLSMLHQSRGLLLQSPCKMCVRRMQKRRLFLLIWDTKAQTTNEPNSKTKPNETKRNGMEQSSSKRNESEHDIAQHRREHS